NRRGQLSEQIKEVLQLSDSEAEQAQSAIDRFLSDYHTAEARTMRRVEPTEQDLHGHQPEETRAFEVPNLNEQLSELRAALFAELGTTLGSDRFQLFRKALRDWMPIDDDYQGMNTGMAVYNFGYRLRFYQPKPGDSWLSWSLNHADDLGNMAGSMPLDDIPDNFRPQLQDWIALAQSRPPRDRHAQK
ncbi:MAG TPA: hypothetical protein VEO53_06255, partial [Candidatus Binatia bacterium]|nr:hypothetical protein [Candidatus Binatia bacterium]